MQIKAMYRAMRAVEDDELSWPKKIALVPLLAILPIGVIIIIGVGTYHFAGWLCCGTPL
jgi:hypothetical protein